MIHDMEIRIRLKEIRRKQDWADRYAWMLPHRRHQWWTTISGLGKSAAAGSACANCG